MLMLDKQNGKVTKEQAQAAMQVTLVVVEYIRQRQEIPEGELYAELMPTGLNKASFDNMLALLVRTGLVTVKSHLVKWVGPEIAEGK